MLKWIIVWIRHRAEVFQQRPNIVVYTHEKHECEVRYDVFYMEDKAILKKKTLL